MLCNANDLIDSAEDNARDFRIHIFPVIPEGVFPMSMTHLTRVNIHNSDRKTDASTTPPDLAQFYNASLRSESLVTAYLKLLHQVSVSCQSFKDCCLLGSVWLRQRGLGKNIAEGGFGPFEWAVVCALLLNRGKLSGASGLGPGCDSHQLFKATLKFLSARDLIAEPFLVATDGSHPSKSDIPIFFDSTKGLNILYKMRPWSYAMVRFPASSAEHQRHFTHPSSYVMNPV